MKNLISANELYPEVVKESVVEIFFNCKLAGIKYCLLRDINCKNTEYLSRVLIVDLENFKIREDWVFHYFIFSNTCDSNFLLIAYKNIIPEDLILTLQPKKIIRDLDSILYEWVEKINWLDQDINQQSFSWVDQQVVADYLDLISGGLTILLPVHWGRPSWVEEKEFDTYSKLFLYTNYLNSNKLEDSVMSKVSFIKNYKIIDV